MMNGSGELVTNDTKMAASMPLLQALLVRLALRNPMPPRPQGKSGRR